MGEFLRGICSSNFICEFLLDISLVAFLVNIGSLELHHLEYVDVYLKILTTLSIFLITIYRFFTIRKKNKIEREKTK